MAESRKVIHVVNISERKEDSVNIQSLNNCKYDSRPNQQPYHTY